MGSKVQGDFPSEVVNEFLNNMKTLKNKIVGQARNNCPNLNKKIGRKIFVARNELGISRDTLARKIGMSKSRLAFLETGKINRIDVLCKIADVLNKPIAWFFIEGEMPDVFGALASMQKKIEELEKKN